MFSGDVPLVEGVDTAVDRAERLQYCWPLGIYTCGKRSARVLVHNVVKEGPILPKEHRKRRLARGIYVTCIKFERA